MPKPVDEELKELEFKLIEYERSVGLEAIQKEFVSRKDYTTLTLEEIHDMSNEELEDASIILVNWSHFLQRKINTYVSWLRWANYKFSLIVAAEGDTFKYRSHEERKSSVALNNEYAKKLNKVILDCQLHIDRLQFLPTSLKDISREIRSCLYGRRMEREHGTET